MVSLITAVIFCPPSAMLALIKRQVKYTRDNNSLALNGAKTQVMIGEAKAKARDNASIRINIDVTEVKPSNSFELLGGVI
jgi:hypothetical protein